MANYELNKVTNIITHNAQEGDYFTLNPFDFNGNVGINEMSVIVQLEEDWNNVTFVFVVPFIYQMPVLNFKANFTSFSFVGGQSPLLIAGNDYDNWDNGFIYNNGVMSWTPQSLEVLPGADYGWWLVEQPNTQQPFDIGLARSVDGGSQYAGGQDAFKEVFSKLK